jgi:DNA-binding CsgD family transcriptional regulator
VQIADDLAASRNGAGGSRPPVPNGEANHLESRLGECLAAAQELIGDAFGADDEVDLADPAQTKPVVAAAVQRLAEDLHRPSSELKRPELLRRSELALELQGLQHDLEGRRLGQSLHALESVQIALSRLRGVDAPAAIVERGLSVLCEDCDFDRAVLFRVHDSRLVAESACFSRDPEWAARFIEKARAHPVPLSLHGYPETEMFRRRAPVLVQDGLNDPSTYKPIVEAIQTRSYVAAPIMPAGKVIGFLHADAYYADRVMTPLDRDTLWAFAEGFGYALQRTLLVERLRSQRDQVRQMVVSTEAVVNELTDAEVELLRADDEGAALTRTAAAVFVAPESRLDALLTRRELEVLELVAEGETNGGIADRLVISEGTVKSHVKHILRKLRAANRAEAVSRYMKLRRQGSAR